jgi:hypothetical protein
MPSARVCGSKQGIFCEFGEIECIVQLLLCVLSVADAWLKAIHDLKAASHHRVRQDVRSVHSSVIFIPLSLRFQVLDIFVLLMLLGMPSHKVRVALLIRCLALSTSALNVESSRSDFHQENQAGPVPRGSMLQEALMLITILDIFDTFINFRAEFFP